MDVANAQIRHGGSDADWSRHSNVAAGALLRIVDDMSDYNQPWHIGGKYDRKFADRWPATFVNARHGGVYEASYGLVLRPDLARIRCGYAADGRSMDKGCEQEPRRPCVPGCTPQTRWCDAAQDVSSYHIDCAWSPSHLEHLTRQQDFLNSRYNEIVIDPAVLESRLPHAVLAVFHHADGGAAAKDGAHRIHANFHHEFRRQLGGSSRLFPILEYRAGGEPPTFACTLCG